jgi:hypothetical protein
LLVLGEHDAGSEARQWASQVEPGLIRYRLIGWWFVVLTSVVALLVLLVGESAGLSAMLKALREQGLPRRAARLSSRRTTPKIIEIDGNRDDREVSWLNSIPLDRPRSFEEPMLWPPDSLARSCSAGGEWRERIAAIS